MFWEVIYYHVTQGWPRMPTHLRGFILPQKLPVSHCGSCQKMSEAVDIKQGAGENVRLVAGCR